MRILVTGAAGFLGQHLVKKLMGDGHEIVGLDNFQTGSEANVIDGCPIVPMDVRDLCTPLWPSTSILKRTHPGHRPEDDRFDRIYHLACPASPPQYQKDQLETFLTALDGTHAVLKVAARWKARVLIASTSEVYGDPKESPQTEEYRGHVAIHGPRACYDEGKRAAETLTALYGQKHHVETRIARIFNTYGPGMNLEDGRAIPNFITQALLGDPITLYGSGSQTRSFCYVSDLIDGLIALMEHPKDIGPTNLGNADEYTLKYLAETIRDLAGSHSGFTYMALPKDDPMQRKPALQKARTELHWSPRVSLRVGLGLTIQDIKDRLKEASL